jgi:N-acetylmuramoyl-L-alanine amidase
MKNYTLITGLFLLCSFLAFSTEKAKPKEGEGINSFLLNNGRNPKHHYDQFVELNKNKLGKNYSLLKDVHYILPPLTPTVSTINRSTGTSSSGVTSTKSAKSLKANTFIEPLFGKQYDEYTIQSNKLTGATFYLVSGHGGPDCGAIGYVNGTAIHEKEYAYDIMLRLARNMKMEGATVHIIIQDKNDGIRDDMFLKNNKKETCRGKEIPRNQKKRLQQRCDEINALSRASAGTHQRAVFIHLDSRSQKTQLDVFFFHNSTSAAGKNLANTMRTTFKEQYQKHQPDRGFNGTVSSRDLHVLVNTNPVSLFAELGNIQNTLDQKRFLSSKNRQYLADWMRDGLIADYKNSRK